MDEDDLMEADRLSNKLGSGGSASPTVSSLQTHSEQSNSLDDYIKDSEEGLSAALGSRWDAKKIEKDADQSTRALLRGISGPRALGAIHALIGSVGASSLLEIRESPSSDTNNKIKPSWSSMHAT